MNPAQQSYDAGEREIFAILFVLKKFRVNLLLKESLKLVDAHQAFH